MHGKASVKAVGAGASANDGGELLAHAGEAATVARSLPTARPRDVQLQGLRGLAMSIVFLGHFAGVFLPLIRNEAAQQAIWMHLLAQVNVAQFGSSTFLMISGFVLYARADHDTSFSWKPYLRARFLRLLPLYWFALAGKIVWELGFAGRERLPAESGEAILYVLSNAFLLFPFSKTPALITVSWTMTYLFIGYLTVPAIGRAGVRWGLEIRGRIIALLAFAAFWVLMPIFGTWLSWNGLGLAVGMLTCELNRKWPLRQWRATPWDFGAIIALLSACAFFFGLQNGSILIETRSATFALSIVATMLPGFLLFMVRLMRGGLLNRLLATRVFGWLGDIGYAFYLFHGLGLLACKAVLRSPGNEDLLETPAGFMIALVLTYAFALGVATAIHLAVERPLRDGIQHVGRWSPRWLSPPTEAGINSN